MGWFTSLFSSTKAVDDFTDKDNGHLAKLGGWFGNLNLTQEEIMENNSELAKLSVEKLKALHPFRVVQRIMVSIIMGVWGLWALSLLGCVLADSQVRVNNLIAVAQTQFMWVPISGAVGLYLLGGTWPSRKKD